MSQVRFNHVFVLLMFAAGACALVIPPHVTDRARGRGDVLFKPVAGPVRAVAAWAHARYGAPDRPPGDARPRDRAEVERENVALRGQVAFLTKQLEALSLVEAERRRLGTLLDYFKPVSVIGGDTTPGRESLSLTPAAGVSTAPGTPVMYADGVVGRLVESRRVRLITDPGSALAGEFGRFEGGQLLTVPMPKASVKGAGNGTMRVDNLTTKDVGELKVGDLVIVTDPEPEYEVLRGQILGEVAEIHPLPSKPLFAEILIRPRTDLRKLREVLVMKTKS